MSDLPLLTADPKASYLAHAAEIRVAIDRVLGSGQYILGPEVEAFEREFALSHGGGHAVAVANGTDALELALRAVGLKPGDGVATVGNTVSATVAAIEAAGGKPVLVEIERGPMTMDAKALDLVLQRERGRVKVVVPVHLYGQAANLPAIMEVARKHGVRVVEDCAQAHGAAIAGGKVGTWGDAAAYSFYPTKNLGAFGDGGAVFTTDGLLAERVRALRQYGWRERYVSESAGRNSRLDELQAAVLRVKLRHLGAENGKRRELATRYLEKLAGTKLELPVVAPRSEPVWHQFVVRSPRREALKAHLAAKGIHAGVLYPTPIHRQPAYAQPTLSLPETERACAEVLCLPVHPALTTADVDRVCGEILRWLN